jgi:hypothetical protein
MQAYAVTGSSLFSALLLAGLLAPPFAAAQVGSRSVPHPEYFSSFPDFVEGNFVSAAAGFKEGARSAVKSVDARWVDSICYYTMLGECYQHMGKNADALAQYTAALKLFLVHRDWMLSIDFSTNTIEPQQNVKPIPWGVSKRTTRIGHFPDKFQFFQAGNAAQAVQKGGVVVPTQLTPLYVSEIVRCTVTAIRRRAELMGPVCEHDPLTAQVLDACLRRPAPPNHWSQCWAELQLGCAYVAAGKKQQAVSELTQSLVAGGTYDHPLSCIGMLELGKLAFEKGDFDTAGMLFLEASYSAAIFDRYDIFEESLRWASQTWLVAGKKGVLTPLAPAAAWAKQKRLRSATVTLFTLAAEQTSIQGDAQGAMALLNQARGVINRTEMQLGETGARLNFETARMNFQMGNLKAGETALNAALGWYKGGSRRLFQIALADGLAAGGQITERTADLLYTETLREPLPADWVLEPNETIAVIANPHPLPYEHWLEVALARKEEDKALTITDMIRRHRFYSSLPLGGRLLALRWVLEAPPEALSEKAMLQRQDLLVKFPKYAEASKKGAELRAELEAAPLTAGDDPAAKELNDKRQELAKVSTLQELMLRDIALRREPAEFAFPPLFEGIDFKTLLKPGQLLLSYLATTNKVHAFALTHDRYGHWLIESPAKLKTDLVELYKGWGQHDKVQPVNLDDLKQDKWRTAAERLMKTLTNNMKPQDWEKYDEVIIVPDRLLWYVPFEAFPIGGEGQPLLAQLPLRYAPTVGLSIPDRRTRARVARTGIVAGKMSAREPQEVSAEFVEELRAVDPDATTIPTPLPISSSQLAKVIDCLVVWADIEDSEKAPYDFAPLPLDRGKPGSSLEDWSALPWGGPEEISLPAFHTPCESALKKGNANGDEMFLTLCGLMATGTRTALISRWRVGGRSAMQLLREYHQELPHDSAAEAWRRAVKLLRSSALDSTREPRIKAPAATEGLTGEHPFFWSGYLLADTGSDPSGEPPPRPKPPAAKPADGLKADEKGVDVKPAKAGEAKAGDAKPGDATPADSVKEGEAKDAPPPVKDLKKAIDGSS